ncbi:ABC transporter permease [Micromonospora sp. NPDC049366]|uniref:ABC transporter permease n=1 Tax=Micromonospora sp. NPDC049366 TaxID=3364271 RepID=UPI00379B332B
MTHWTRRPAELLIGLLFPVLLVLMFGYLFGGAMAVPGGGDYREFLLPGMFGLTMAFGLEATYTAVATDTARGVTDRFRSLPMARSAVVAGRAGADLLYSTAGLAVILACGRLVGWQWAQRAGGGRRGGRAAPAAAVRVDLGGHPPGPGAAPPRVGAGAADPRLAGRIHLQRVRGPGDDAGLARRRRPAEPAVGHRGRLPGAVRQPGLGRRLLRRAARPRARGGVAGAADRGLPAPVGAPLPAAQPLTRLSR